MTTFRRACAAPIVAASILVAAGLRPEPATGQVRSVFSVIEADIPSLRRAMEQGVATSRAITEQYLARIERYNGELKAALAVNPRALAEADARDRERKAGRIRGPLHGIPIALKDNIHTLDMPTTGGALAFANLRPPYEATLTRNLREAGAVIIAKTTLTELANWVSSNMPSGYNAIAGFSLNPYYPRRAADGSPELSPGGSSSGIGTAASLWAASVGTETSGSILNPAGETMLVGIKPTVGRISRHGVIPITADRDTPGPMARTVTDAAILLGAMEGSKPDPNDPATRACTPPPGRDYTAFLRADALRGARIGVPRAFVTAIYGRRGRAAGASAADPMAEAVNALRAAGATVIDPADFPSLLSKDPDANILNFQICVGTAQRGCSTVLRYGMKRDFNRWLASLGKAAPVRTLTELRAWNREHQKDGAIRFGQDQLDASDAIDLEADRARYEADLAKDAALAGRDGIDAALREHKLDALIFPSYFGASISARVGYPTVIVPFTAPTIERAAGGGTTVRSAFGVSFTSTACAEPRLIALAYAFEQTTKRRVPPPLD